MARVRSSSPQASEGTLVPLPSTVPAALPGPRAAGTARRKRVSAPLRPPRAGVLGQVALLAGVALAAFSILALATHHGDDVSYSVAGTASTANLGGPLGAHLADVLLQAFGYSAWLVGLLGAWCALRLAGRAVGGWLACVVGAAGFVLLTAGFQLVLGGGAPAGYEPGGLLGLLVSDSISTHVGRVGASIAVTTGILIVATILFGINWQPLAARAVDRIEADGPRAVRGAGSLGAEALSRAARAAAAAVHALLQPLGWRSGERGEDDGDEPDEDYAGDATEAEPPLERAAASPVLVPAVPRRAPDTGLIPVKSRALPPPADLPSELPSVWSARRAPPTPAVPVVEGSPERDAPTQVGQRVLAEVEWENTGSVPLPPHEAGRRGPGGVAGARAPVLRAVADPPVVALPQASPLAPSPLAHAASGPPAVEWADTPPAADWVEEATGGRVSSPAAFAREEKEEDPLDPPSVARPREAAPSSPEAILPLAPPAARAPPLRPRPSGDGVAVLPGNLRSGGAGDDGSAVRKSASPFKLPPLSLLDDHPPIVAGTDEGVLHDMARRLTETLRDFGVEGRVTAIRPGPVITMFEYEPAAGVKLSRITTLTDNLKMALKATSVRIVAPIPGRGCVGIELPNDRRQTVWARDVFASPEFKDVQRSLPMILGKDTEGRPFVTDLAKMPHLLVGGTTGSGKSVGVNAMLVSMLFMRTPDELRMILIDPKMLEFALYEDIPHLLHPVVTEAKFASAVLKWACTEMDERYKVMARWQVRHIDTYNQKVVNELPGWTQEKARSYAPKDWPAGEVLPIPKKFPYIVIVIDELADLMMVASSDVEASIARIVAKARAAGIHLIVATQTPRRDVITGMIKANMPASLAYQVRSALDSRVILDQGGAEALLGKGDLLFLRPGTSDLVRVHAPFLSEDEVHRVADFLRAQGTPQYDLRISASDADEPDAAIAAEYDEKYDEAVEMAIQKGKISTSMLQRHLGIGYNRAANMVDTMEREGVVGPADGARPREVLVGKT